jgi:hypothetical protein
MKITDSIFGLCAVAVAAAAPAFAHHSFPATYLVDQKEQITGTVAAFLFRNPHSFVHIMAPDKTGKVQRWAVEWSGGAALAGQGINATTLKVGDKVKIVGNPGRNAADHRMRMNSIVRTTDGWGWSGTVD